MFLKSLETPNPFKVGSCEIAMEDLPIVADLEKYRIPELPPSAYYISNFISLKEEKTLLDTVKAIPFSLASSTHILLQINNVPVTRWTQLSRRRLQSWPIALTKSNTLLASPLPPWLIEPIIPRFDRLAIFRKSPHNGPNHVLINEYLPRQGIMPHEDGAAYHPIVATVSLGSSIVLEVFEKNGQEPRAAEAQWKILQEPRSLLVTTDAMYYDVLHGISERAQDKELRRDTVANWDLLGDQSGFTNGIYNRQTRVSLTYRDVLKVSKVGNSLAFLTNK